MSLVEIKSYFYTHQKWPTQDKSVYLLKSFFIIFLETYAVKN